MTLGSVLFLGAAFVPAIQRHWATPRVLVPDSDQVGWLFGYLFFAAGALITAVGFAVLGGHLRKLSGAPLVKATIYSGDAFVVIGAICWIMDVAETISPSLSATFPDIPLFPVYFNLSLFGLIIYGYALIEAGFARWLGWGTIGFYTLILILYLIMGDMPPAVLYVWPIVLGIASIINRGPSRKETK